MGQARQKNVLCALLQTVTNRQEIFTGLGVVEFRGMEDNEGSDALKFHSHDVRTGSLLVLNFLNGVTRIYPRTR